MTMTDVNDITRAIILILALAVLIKTIIVLRRKHPVHFFVAIFPFVFSAEIVLFFGFQHSGQVDPLVLNWFSQLIRVQALIYFLAV